MREIDGMFDKREQARIRKAITSNANEVNKKAQSSIRQIKDALSPYHGDYELYTQGSKESKSKKSWRGNNTPKSIDTGLLNQATSATIKDKLFSLKYSLFGK